MQAAGIIAATLLAVGPQAQRPQQEPVLHLDCTVVSIEPQGLIVGSRVPGVGFIESLSVEEGDQVNEGQVIGRFDDRLQRVELEIQEEKVKNDVNIKYAEAQHDVAAMAETKLKAVNDLVPTTVPELEIVQAGLEKRRTVLQKEQAEHQRDLDGLELKRARLLLDHHGIHSPATGKVYRILRRPGEPVRQGETILTILRTDRFRVEAEVAAKDYSRIRKGQPVEVRIVPFDEESQNLPLHRDVYQGRVVAALPYSNANLVPVIAEIQNHNGLLFHGLKAKMTIHLTAPTTGLSQTRRSQ